MRKDWSISDAGGPAMGKQGHEHQTGDQAQMLEEAVGGHGAGRPLERPERVGDQSRDRRQHAERTGTEPDQATADHQDRSDQLDDDGGPRPKPARVQAEMSLFRGGGRKIGQFDDAAQQIGGTKAEPVESIIHNSAQFHIGIAFNPPF